ncbi:hypothetical protein G8C92_29520 [Paenibacillus donghaensis]|uniref:hypothetical protein n=1 Tax=Paenibacillus donghaensis TaxID=414771 RepID=UPI0018832785|nr:hypothetical protein [Paenibacillus donghaensis]MBE9918141.1 hypothetical protein [Paenibacillus donghaensis]
MIWFILFITAALGISIAAMVRKQKSAREIGLFVSIVLLGIADWISIFLGRKFRPHQLIATLLDWFGL